MSQNRAVYLDTPGAALRIDGVSMPEPGADDLVIKNVAVAINPIDVTQAKTGMLLQTFPAVLGQDVAGEVIEVGTRVTRFRRGDRVIAHAWTMTPKGAQTGPDEAGFALYTKVKAGAAAVLPARIPFSEGVVLPLALDTAIAGLYQAPPYLDLPLPTSSPKQSDLVLIVYGGSSSVGISATQLAVASGVRVVSIASSRNHSLCRTIGASNVFDQTDAELINQITEAVGTDKLAGIYDAISSEVTVAHDLEILAKLGGGRVAVTRHLSKSALQQQPPNVQVTMVFGLGEFSFPIWESFVAPALESGELKCLPKPVIAGRGLEAIETALEKHALGVSAQKIVVELDT